MKRISSIELDNCRAFFGRYDPILLPNGCNLLVYGENGSGKSSLFKAIDNFFSSSTNSTQQYVRNHHQIVDDGELTLTFNDFDIVTRSFTSKIGQSITFGSAWSSTNFAPFVKDAELIKGFLDYRSLLDVYNHRTAQPNLFQLIIPQILKNYIPPGATYSIGRKWTQLEVDLRDVYNRNERRHKRALGDLPIFEGLLRTSLDRIFLQLNVLLVKYFKFNLRVGYSLQPMLPYNYIPGKWHITADLRLNLTLNGMQIIDQSDVLNEARLSALAICLYLAVMLRNPQSFEYKILFLDDVFVGLDAGNRLPILNILRSEFSEYQIFISTYDRHWFELAKRHFEIYSPSRWSTAEFYVGTQWINGIKFSKPIIVRGETNFEKAVAYLHNRVKPDYPAAANYFRKGIEELIQKFIPKWELADAENTQIPDYQLTSLVMRTSAFLERTGNSCDYITAITALLPTLLHPLSHHEISSPIYKSELFNIETNIEQLRTQLTNLCIPDNFRCALEPGKRLRFTFEVNAAQNHYCFYELVPKEALTLKRMPGGAPELCKFRSVADRYYGHNGGTPYPARNPDKKKAEFNYNSVQDAYTRIHAYLSNSVGAFVAIANPIDAVHYHDGISWQPLNSLITSWY